jgi:hypothetical protein
MTTKRRGLAERVRGLDPHLAEAIENDLATAASIADKLRGYAFGEDVVPLAYFAILRLADEVEASGVTRR